MFHNARLLLVLAASLLLGPGFGPCDRNGPPAGGGQTNTPAPRPEDGARLRQTRRPPRVLYHGVHPGSAGGDETTVDELGAYVGAVGKKVAFVYFTQELNAEWLNDQNDQTAFPAEQVAKIREHGAIPFIRLMTRKHSEINEEENLEDVYTYDVLIGDPAVRLSPKDEETKEKFRRRMLAWAEAAGDQPLFVEWGTEANGKWFWWNARWHADGPCQQLMRERRPLGETCRARLLEGTRKFQLAFKALRRLVNVEGGARNVKWVFHVASGSDPNPAGDYDWNAIENYYPGADCPGCARCPECVDAVGVSVYGPQKLGEDCGDSFESQMDRLLKGEGSGDKDSLKRIVPAKKVFVLEFGHTLINGGGCNPARWTESALKAMFDPGKWPGVTLAGFSWWNESWVEAEEDDDPKSVTDMRLQRFDLCRDNEEEAEKVRRVLPCECWTRGGDDCYNLRERRDRLRTAFKDTLDDRKYRDYLRTRPDDALFR